MREKLIELMDEVDNLCRNTDCEDCVLCVAENCNIIHMADHLLANGVTLTDNHVGKWIPVTERLPEDRQRVLCYKQAKYGSCVMTAAYSQCLDKYCGVDFHGVKHGGFFDYDSEVGYYELRDVTHWMPLPPPPKEEAEQL